MEFKKGDKVKLKLSILKNKLSFQILMNILKFDNEYSGIHIITNIYTKNLYTKDVIYRYELDNKFVFYKDELIKN